MQFNIKYGNLTAVCKMIIMYDLLFAVMDKDSALCLVSDSLLFFFPEYLNKEHICLYVQRGGCSLTAN